MATGPVKISAFTVITPFGVPVTEVAPALEARGIHAMYVGEHHHLPTVSKHPVLDPMPEFYKYVPDPLQVLSMAAAVTTRLRLGTSICLVVIHDPIVLASRVGTLDALSGGRVTLGMGVGWNAAELRNHGVDPATRRDRFREYVLAMQRMWESETCSFDGEFVRFTELWQGPKPVQRPRPPMILGGRANPKTFQHIAECCDGWLPTSVYQGDLAPQLAELRRAFEAAGRDPATLHNLFLYAELGLFERAPDEYAKALPTKADLEQLADIGIHEVAIGIPSFTHDNFHGALDLLTEALVS